MSNYESNSKIEYSPKCLLFQTSLSDHNAMASIPSTIATMPNTAPRTFAFQELAAEAPPPLLLLLPPLPPVVLSALFTDSKALDALARIVAKPELKLALQLASEIIELVISAKELSASAEFLSWSSQYTRGTCKDPNKLVVASSAEEYVKDATPVA
ncbi:hypothetical protein AC579_6639 [Pseudocercospora musae]|uniref:Uncharacterized protein n=1 Tax=Pseudocercospora musae TaxID=113226 RepID=A0A139IPW8_9PEZI|nr:hypothetical protein AC579_6639 [Pseudocercospora musae]KXT16596.1 hypothetical protein AC579_6639 [Pseudocercospora musae]